MANLLTNTEKPETVACETETLELGYHAKVESNDSNYQWGRIVGSISSIGSINRNGSCHFPGMFDKILADKQQQLSNSFVSLDHDWSNYMAMPEDIWLEGNILYGSAKFHSTPDAQNLRQKITERIENGHSVGQSITHEFLMANRIWFDSGKEMATFIKDNPKYDVAEFNMKQIEEYCGMCRAILSSENILEWAIAPVPADITSKVMEANSGKSLDTQVAFTVDVIKNNIERFLDIAELRAGKGKALMTDQRLKDLDEIISHATKLRSVVLAAKNVGDISTNALADYLALATRTKFRSKVN